MNSGPVTASRLEGARTQHRLGALSPYGIEIPEETIKKYLSQPDDDEDERQDGEAGPEAGF
jgi:hypothetical protein